MGHRTETTRRFIVLGVLAALHAAPFAHAQDYGFDWVTIGDPGNRDTLPHEVTRNPNMQIGGVDYEYRMMRTEVTVQQHLDFLNAVWPYLEPHQRLRGQTTGQWVLSRTWNENDPQYYAWSGMDDVATNMSFRTAAMFANWLTNDKADGAWAIQDGAYDTFTFGENEDGTLTDQERHHSDAKVWLPTIDEMAKATYWDPAKDGEGGYWLYPHSSDDVPISGFPWEGGETSAGLDGNAPYLDAGSYPWAASPWGLLDGSGGEWETVEDMDSMRFARIRRGSKQFQDFWSWEDRLDTWTSAADFGLYGIRFAAAVPSPHTACAVCGLLGFHLTRRRRSSAQS